MSYMEGKMREDSSDLCLAETKSEPKQSRNARSSSLFVLLKSPATLETPKASSNSLAFSIADMKERAGRMGRRLG